MGYLFWRKTLVTFLSNQITRKNNMFPFDNIRLSSIYLYKRKFIIWGRGGEQIDIDINWIKESNKHTSLFVLLWKWIEKILIHFTSFPLFKGIYRDIVDIWFALCDYSKSYKCFMVIHCNIRWNTSTYNY